MDWKGAKGKTKPVKTLLWYAKQETITGNIRSGTVTSKLLPKYLVKCPFLKRTLEM